MSINENSARSRWAFLKKAFASMALGAAGAVSLKSAIQPDERDPSKTNRQGMDRDEEIPGRYQDKFRITKLENRKAVIPYLGYFQGKVIYSNMVWKTKHGIRTPSFRGGFDFGYNPQGGAECHTYRTGNGPGFAR
ncbi:MAG TPA: hypothetical protein ENI20_18810 [Bacteroides sp.]|nr:hypothetical protein [Bacteroides sp.]